MASTTADAMAGAMTAEREALGDTGGVTDGSVAVGVTPSTPRVPADVRPERTRSRDLADFPVPTGREEEWRFTPLERVRPLLDAPVGPGLTTVLVEPREGVEVVPGEPVDTPLPVDRLSLTAELGATSVLRVAKGAEPGAPVVLRRTVPGAEVAHDHLVLEVGEQARATVVLEHTGGGSSVGKVSVLLGDGASLDLVCLQLGDDDAVQSTHVASRLGRDARLRSTQVTLGGSLVRVVETVEFAAPGGEVDLRGVSLADDGQHLEHRLFVDHAVPHCTSRVTYKSALQGDEAHTVWVGDVLIRAEAVGTDTYELNRNLLLTPEARADSVPNLEIETGEITGAGHASATGRFDDAQLFYLQSRGIAPDEARRMVVRGFFAEVLLTLDQPELTDRLLATIDADLGRSL